MPTGGGWVAQHGQVFPKGLSVKSFSLHKINLLNFNDVFFRDTLNREICEGLGSVFFRNTCKGTLFFYFRVFKFVLKLNCC